MQIASKSGKANFKKTISIAVVLVVLIAAVVIVVNLLNSNKLDSNKIYEGVYIGDQDVSGLTIEEAAKKVEDSYKIDKSRTLSLICEGKTTSLSLEELGLEIDGEKSAQNAFEEGRQGTKKERLNRIKEIKKNKAYVHVAFKYANDNLDMKIIELANQVDEPEREVAVSLEGDEIVITKGKAGKRIIPEKAKILIEKAFLDPKANEVEIVREDIVPPEVNVEYISKQICTEPQDASYKIENYKLTIIEEKVGIEIDLDKAKVILDETPGDVVRIPVKTTQPKVTAQTINEELFPDLLGTYTTTYNAGNTSRSHNMWLASDKISNVVLAPGEVFSYNDIVGPRTAERGFKEAGVYVGNKVEQGLGGGICQVSSTLFNAVVYADLNIVYRTNHSLPVSYVPLGRDATVSYGSIDFKFSNNTDAPVKIMASCQNGKNTVNIYGVKKNTSRTIEISTECTGTYAPNVKKIEDPLLPVGEIEVEESGSSGSSYVTYKTTKENGKTIKTEVLTKSSYSATDRVERVGTMEEVPTETPSPEEQITDGNQTSPEASGGSESSDASFSPAEIPATDSANGGQ